ncbi:Phage tail fibre adhesin Gp38 [uncultured Mediterranean phage uvMED]|nr:Phage tail fibre adhesin Gp38 [uncultured Mediterranean phage uvMED]BAR19715.1 Phage tail fibre adhesin Gp38 [uncultured Mediterranean phage uvMED]
MTLPSSGTLTINNIVGEFGGSAPHGLSEYYRNGGLVTPQNTTVPTSGAISISDFYGTVAQTTTTITSSATINGQSNRKQITASSFVTTGNILRIPSGFWVWSDSVTVPALIIDIPCEIQNEGKIIGKGGYGSFGSAGNAQDGGDAIKINSGVSGVVITNASGAFIAGGGGGGGGSGTNGTSTNGFGGGGAGGGAAELDNPNPPSNAAQGGVLNAKGGDATSGTGGGAGGGGGSYAGGAGGFISSGGGGGRILGSGATGGVTGGGANGSAGANSTNSNLGGGGGGWGASGGNGTDNNGGAGGKAIEDTGNTYTLSNSGTIYGATT